MVVVVLGNRSRLIHQGVSTSLPTCLRGSEKWNLMLNQIFVENQILIIKYALGSLITYLVFHFIGPLLVKIWVSFWQWVKSIWVSFWQWVKSIYVKIIRIMLKSLIEDFDTNITQLQNVIDEGTENFNDLEKVIDTLEKIIGSHSRNLEAISGRLDIVQEIITPIQEKHIAEGRATGSRVDRRSKVLGQLSGNFRPTGHNRRKGDPPF